MKSIVRSWRLWTIAVLVALGVVGGVRYHRTVLAQSLEKQRAVDQRRMNLACLRVIMWLEASGKLKGLKVHAFQDWLPAARKTADDEGRTKYEWGIHPEFNEGLCAAWIVVKGESVVDGGYVTAEY